MDLMLLLDVVNPLGQALLEAVREKAKLPEGWKAISRHLTEEERNSMRADVAERLIDVFRKLPDDKEFEAAARAGSAKKGWYANSAKTLLDVFGPDAPRFAAVLASTSPQVSVKENLRNSLRIWKNWVEAGRPTDNKGIDEVGEKSIGAERWHKMGWKNNATRSLQHPSPEKIVLSSGGTPTNPHVGKVDSFRANLLGDLSRVTNDAWMAHFGDVDQALFSSKAGYLAMTARVRRVAKKMGWDPAEVQETVWSFFKALHESQGKGKVGRAALADLKDSKINDTPDFAVLMAQDPEIQDALKTLRAQGLGGEPPQDVRGGGPEAEGSPLARAEAAGLAGHLARIADRAELLKHRTDIQDLSTRGYTFTNSATQRLTPRSATILVTDPREIAELNEKKPLENSAIITRKDGKWDVLHGARIITRETTPEGEVVRIDYTDRKTVPAANIDPDQWRTVERKKAERASKVQPAPFQKTA